MPITPSQFVQNIDNLVSLPEACFEIERLANDPNSSAVDIAHAVSQDAYLAAQLLKIANSSYYSFPMPVDTLSKAIAIIGVQDLKDLAISTGIIQAFSKSEIEVLNLKAYWRHSVFTGLLARQLGAKTQTRVLCRERLFVAGLLHDIGMLAMCVKIPEVMRIVFERNGKGRESYLEVEKLVFGLAHTDIGAQLMHKWGLPKSLQDIARYHHNPSRAKENILETNIIHIASSMSQYLGFSPVSSKYPVKISTSAWKQTGLTKEKVAEVVETTRTEFNNAINVFIPERQVANY